MENRWIETEGLSLRPLNRGQLLQYIQMDPQLEENWGLKPSARTISPELREALEDTIIPSVSDTNRNYLFSTLWTVISKDLNQMVAAFCFQGEPNHQGEIEIGYGTIEQFQGKGYMTKAVAAIIPWAASQSNVVSIIAETELTNQASIVVLIKNQFVKVNEIGDKTYWKLNLK